MTITHSITRILLLFSLVSSSFTCLPSHARAAITEYTNRTDFENAIFNSTLFDFDNQPGGQTNLGDSVDFGEATISVDAVGAGVWSTSLFGAPTIQIASLNGTNLRIELNSGFTALGMDIGELNGQRNFQLVLGGSSGTLLDVNRFVTVNDALGTASTTFYGFVSDSDEIRSLNIPDSSGFEVIDNLIYGSRSVPEPSTLLLGALASVGLLTHRRRYK